MPAPAGFHSLGNGMVAGWTAARSVVAIDDSWDRGVRDERLDRLLGTPRRRQGGPHAQNEHERSPHYRLLRKFPPLRGGRYLRFARTNRCCFSFRFSARPAE